MMLVEVGITGEERLRLMGFVVCCLVGGLGPRDSVAEMARRLRVSESTVYRYRRWFAVVAERSGVEVEGLWASLSGEALWEMAP